MAFTQLVSQQNFSGPTTMPNVNAALGTPGVSGSVHIPVGSSSVTFRLTSNNWTPSNDFVEWTMDYSRDSGDTWEQVFSGIANEGALGGRDQTIMPTASWNLGQEIPPITQDIDIRCRYRVQGALRFGLEWELL
jgi:hypothetical protein